MSDSTKEQWNLQAMDVSGAWRFNRGSSDVVLVSLDNGIGDIAGNPTDIHDEIGHVDNKLQARQFTAWTQGHGVMAAKHDSQNLAGIAPGRDLGYNVYWWCQILRRTDATCAKAEKSLFSKVALSNSWWTDGATKAQMEDLIESTSENFCHCSRQWGPTNY